MQLLKKSAWLMFVPILFACKPEKEKSISGTITNLPKSTLISLYELNPNKMDLVDSVRTSDGNFAFDPVINEPTYFRIQLPDRTFVNIIMKPGEKIRITSDYSTFGDQYVVEGSEESKLLQSYNKIVKDNFLQREELNTEYQNNINHPKIDSLIKVYGEKYNALISDLEKRTMQLIDTAPATFVALSAVEQLDKDKYFAYYLKVDSAFAQKYPESKYFKSFHERVQKMKKLAPGVPAPDIVLPDVKGNTRRLSDLKGKYVLIDFWASWCKPCRAENPNVVRLYKKYNSKGFEIFSVSLDGLPHQPNPKELWLQAIKEDGLIWPNHVSDLQGWNSPVVAIYEIQGIPFTVLVGPDGNIIAKNLRGKSLEDKLKEIFGE